MKIRIHNPIYGVPITLLDKYNSEQFEVAKPTNSRKEFDKNSYPVKRYENAIQHNKNGSTTNESKANIRAIILVDNVKDTYYTADNSDGKLVILYVRIFVRCKNDNKDNK